MWCITLVDLPLLKNACIPEIKPTWSWCMTLLYVVGFCLLEFCWGVLHPCSLVILACNFFALVYSLIWNMRWCVCFSSLSPFSLFLSLPSSPLLIYSIVLLSSFGGPPSKPTTGSQRDCSAEPVGCGRCRLGRGEGWLSLWSQVYVSAFAPSLELEGSHCSFSVWQQVCF